MPQGLYGVPELLNVGVVFLFMEKRGNFAKYLGNGVQSYIKCQCPEKY